VTLPAPELAAGAVDAGVMLLPVPLVPELDFLALPGPELPVLELCDVRAAELRAVPVLAAAAEPELADEMCCAPGSANATAPAVTTPRTPAAAVTVRSRARPRSRSATARLVSCECLLIEWSSLLGS
jgi:hypothetical protein